MSAQLHFNQCDIWDLPFKEKDKVLYKNTIVEITRIYLRDYNGFINDIIVVFSNGDYAFHDDYELTRLDGNRFDV